MTVAMAGHTPSAPKPWEESSFEPYTPPYYDGYSHLELTYIPNEGGDKSITDIMKDVTVTSYRETTRPHSRLSGTTAWMNGMPLSASINWNQIVSVPSKAGLEERLVIQPKWECPVLDFAQAPITLPEYGSDSVAKGMWHQAGTIPSAYSGIILEVKDIPHKEIEADPDTYLNTQSLSKLLGFKDSNVPQWTKIGEIPDEGKTISEAIVAIPFRYDHNQKNKFYFPINRTTIDWAQAIIDGKEADLEQQLKKLPPLRKPANSVVKMVNSMRKYSIPPQFDFLNNVSQNPFAMVFFEFSMHLNQDDLVNIWQNVLPNAERKNAASGIQCAVGEIDIGLNLLSEWDKTKDATWPYEEYKGFDLLNSKPAEPWGGGLPNNIQWMVFKVKQKAQTNYFDLTAQRDLGKRTKQVLMPTFTTGPSFWGLPGMPMLTFTPIEVPIQPKIFGSEIPPYSYNWPYDFCSIVELAKIESTARFEPHDSLSTLGQNKNKDFNISMKDILDSVGDNNPPVFGISDNISDFDIKKTKAAVTSADILENFVNIPGGGATANTMKAAASALDKLNAQAAAAAAAASAVKIAADPLFTSAAVNLGASAWNLNRIVTTDSINKAEATDKKATDLGALGKLGKMKPSGGGLY
tara:strand:+ start:284 stop:2185 length:1902 start_codon:yes stop_codon:yes gene_type:complete